MKVIKKINNNVAIGLDGNNREVVIFGRGIGFGEMPYELKDLSKIDRTYYDIDRRYYGLLAEIPDKTFFLVTKLLDIAKTRIKGRLNPNLVFVLADHINFSIERERKGMNVTLPYSYEMEYDYPELTRIAQWFVRKVNEKMKVHLGRGEVTSITMHFLNALEGEKMPEKNPDRTARIIQEVTVLVEEYFGFAVDKNSFHYFRFKNHIKYFVLRKERNEEFNDSNEELYQEMKEKNPQIRKCVAKIDDYMEQEFGERCPHEELLYLMIHVNQLYAKEIN